MNLAKIKLLEAHIMAYNIRGSFIIPTLVDKYSGAVEDFRGNRATTEVYLLSHWSKFFLHVVSKLQSNSYINCN